MPRHVQTTEKLSVVYEGDDPSVNIDRLGKSDGVHGPIRIGGVVKCDVSDHPVSLGKREGYILPQVPLHTGVARGGGGFIVSDQD